jgi:shikimate kinase
VSDPGATTTDPSGTASLTGPVVLVGMMGSGKTTIGKKVAAALGVPFVDTDAEIEQREGRSVADLFARDGEPAFRQLEAAMLDDVVRRDAPMIVATGGGAVLADANRQLLRTRALVIWLRADAGLLAHRVADDESRPLLVDDARGTLERLIREREPLYREVADRIVEVDRSDRKVMVARVLDAVASGVAAGAHP